MLSNPNRRGTLKKLKIKNMCMHEEIGGVPLLQKRANVFRSSHLLPSHYDCSKSQKSYRDTMPHLLILSTSAPLVCASLLILYFQNQ
jgi:hypothetical protein